MNNVKTILATTLSALTMTIAGTAFAGDAAMHMDFYEQDKVSKTTNMVEKTELVRAQSIVAPMVTSTVVQEPINVNYAYTQQAKPKRVFQQKVYSVRSGDTLIRISKKTGVDVLELARLNQIKFKDLDHIKVGQKLKLI